MNDSASTSEIDNLHDENAVVGHPANAKPQDRPPSSVAGGVDNEDVNQNGLQGEVEGADETTASSRKKRKRIRMMCFSCNRPDGHYLSIRPRWLYSFLLGMTFGMIHLFGPFRCQCCGSARLMPADWMNLRYWARHFGSRSRS